MIRKVSLVVTAGVLLAGCVTRQDIKGIQTDLYNIKQGIDDRLGGVKDQTENVQTSQADLSQQIGTLNAQITALQAELADYQQRMAQVSGHLDDLEASLTARMDTQIELLSGSKFVEKPLPSTAFNLANTDFARGKYEESIKGFQTYIKQFPKSARVVEARLKIGDAHAKLKDVSSAIESYGQIVRDHPKDKFAPTALFRKATALEQAGRKGDAKDAYTQLIQAYPYAEEAKTAQDRVRSQAN